MVDNKNLDGLGLQVSDLSATGSAVVLLIYLGSGVMLAHRQGPVEMVEFRPIRFKFLVGKRCCNERYET